MNKRNRNLIALLTVMLLLVIGLCACMTGGSSGETNAPTPSTTQPAYGVDEWEDADETEETGSSEPASQTQGTEEPSQTTQPAQSETTEATAATTPTETTPASAPTEGTTQPTTSQSTYTPGSLSYSEYMELTAEQQQQYALSFSSVTDYINWFNAEKEKFENDQVIEITGPVDLGGLSGNN